MLLPGGGRSYLRRLGDSLDQTAVELRGLEPPPNDKADLEEHFIKPFADFGAYLHQAADAAPVWLSFKATLARINHGPDPKDEDRQFCERYGLEANERHVSLAERASAVGLTMSMHPFASSSSISDTQMRRIRRGGAKPSSILILSTLAGLVCALAGLNNGTTATYAAGFGGFAFMSIYLWIVFHRAGSSFTRRATPGAFAVPAVVVRYRSGNLWRVAVVTEETTDAPVSAPIVWMKLGTRSTAFFALAIGDVAPGGRFALALADERTLVTIRDARASLWPPIGYKKSAREP